MIKDMVNHPANSTARCEEAYAKAQELQDKLNAVITFVDPKDQLAQLPEGGLLHGVPIAIKQREFVQLQVHVFSLTTFQSMMRQSQRNYEKQVQYVSQRHPWMNLRWVAQT